MRLPDEAIILLNRGLRSALARQTRYPADPEFRDFFYVSCVTSPLMKRLQCIDRKRRARPTRIKAALARDPGQTMKSIGAFSIAATEGRERGNSRHVRAGQREAVGA